MEPHVQLANFGDLESAMEEFVIEYTIKEAEGILLLKPLASLSGEDFAGLTKAVDTYLADHPKICAECCSARVVEGCGLPRGTIRSASNSADGSYPVVDRRPNNRSPPTVSLCTRLFMYGSALTFRGTTSMFA